MDTIKITFVNGFQRVVKNTNYDNIRDCIIMGQNLVINGVTDKNESVTYVTSNILTVEKVIEND